MTKAKFYYYNNNDGAVIILGDDDCGDLITEKYYFYTLDEIKVMMCERGIENISRMKEI